MPFCTEPSFLVDFQQPTAHYSFMYYPASRLNFTELLRDGRHFAERHGDNVHIIDSITGDKYIIKDTPGLVPGVLRETTLPSGVKVWTEEGIEAAVVGGRPTIAFSPAIISEMCQRIAEGASITKLCKMSNMPTYAQLRLWARTNPWIDQEFDRARRDRAETMRDHALDSALEATDKNNAPAQALKTDTYRWLAGVDNEKYNPKTKVEATVTAPTQIVVYTGIDRAPSEVRHNSEREATEIPPGLQKYEGEND